MEETCVVKILVAMFLMRVISVATSCCLVFED